jgi:UDP-N-acetylglucosamine 4,6-dehydratase
MDLAKAIAPECKHEMVGIRPGEKLHEILVPEDDARRTVELDNYYIIQPELSFWSKAGTKYANAKKCADGFSYTSDNNTQRLSLEELRSMIGMSKLELQENAKHSTAD